MHVPRVVAESWPRWLSLPALSRRTSLKLRLTIITVGLFVAFIWVLAFVSSTVLETRVQQLLADQQLAATKQLAREVDQRLKDNIDGLILAAAGLPRDFRYATLQPLLAQRPLMHVAFSAGLVVVGRDGYAIADYPALGRHKAYYGDRAWFRQVVATSKPHVDKPAFDPALLRSVLPLAVPVFDAGGLVRGVFFGGIDLEASNFLRVVSDPSESGDSELYVVSPRDKLIIAASDGKRAMTPTADTGRNLLYDRMVDGFEGSGVSVNSAGISKLYSAQRVPTANWLVVAALPTHIAFAPLRTTQRYLYAFAALLTLVAVFAIGLAVRRILEPLETATRAIGQMTDGQFELGPLRVQRDDEIGALVRNFNHLVADRLEYEAALTDSEQRFRLLVEGAPDAVFVQTHGCFAYVNAAALALFGATGSEQLLGRPILDRMHPDCRAMVAEQIRRVNEERQNTPVMEQSYLRLDGSSVAVEALAVASRYGDDDGAIVFVRDISDKKHVTVELDRYRNNLEGLVAERTAQLAEAKLAAEAATRAKSEFLADMSHEIRTPLGIIVGLGNLLRQKLRDPALERRLAQLCNSADHLSAVVNDILDLSKIDAGHPALDESDFRLGAILDKVTNLVGELTRERGLTLAVEAAPELRDAQLRGDALRLAQVLINLAGNAVKFTERGSVCVGVTTLAATPAHLRLRFAVKDTGIGIAPQDAQRLFRAYEQADNSTTRTQGGTGLGLAISQRLVALMGGAIGLDSQPGVGSTFSFELTLARGSGPRPASSPASATPNFAGARVLVAEDHPVNQELMLDLLEILGCEAEIASDGAEALDCARATAYDLILMDLRMPRMDGLEACRAIRALPQHRGTPILAVTASAFSEDRRHCLDAGMNGSIRKPFTLATLANDLKQWLPDFARDGGHLPERDEALDQALDAIPGLDATCLFRRTAEHPAAYAALLRRYVDLHEDDMVRLSGHLAAADRDAARGVVHQLKSVSAFIGGERIAALAAEIDAVLRAGADSEVVARLAASCAAELASLAAAIRGIPAAAA